MKSKLLIIVMALVLFVNSYDLKVFANTDYDHNELLDYPGYGEAMYETIVEETTFISGRYTDNIQYVSDSIDEVTNFAKDWYNKTTNTLGECYNFSATFVDCFGAHYEVAGGTILTVADWIKSFFSDYEETVNPELIDYSGYEQYFNWVYQGIVELKEGYDMVQTYADGSTFTSTSRYRNLSVGFWTNKSPIEFSTVYRYVAGSKNVLGSPFYAAGEEIVKKHDEYKSMVTNVSGVMNVYHLAGATVVIKKNNVVQHLPLQGDSNPNLNRINNYIKENTPQVVVPKPTAYLSCPDGTRINMVINGGTFLDVKGQVMQVSNDGTATIDGQLCNLGWEKPTVQYVDDTGRVGISTPDGKIIDAETGDTISGGEDIDFDDTLEGCDGVLCGIGKLLGGLASIAKAILGIPLKILDGLLELFKKIIVPPDGFWTKEIEEIEKQFFKDEIKENIDSLKDLGGAAGGQFQDVSVSLMGVDNVTVVDSDSINMSLDTIHGWVRGIFYPLLLFFNISMLYRLIRGTSFVGIGETKGGGDK